MFKINSAICARLAFFVSVLLLAGCDLTVIGNPPDGMVGMQYSTQFSADKGLAPHMYGVTAGNLPAGLSLDSRTGVVSGIPTVAGQSVFKIGVMDASRPRALTGENEFSITILDSAQLIISSNSSVVMRVGERYLQTQHVYGGKAPYTFRIIAGAIPAGTTLDASTGTVGGVPSQTGAFSYRIQVEDALGMAAVSEVAGVVTMTLNLTSSPSPMSQVGENYTQTHTVSAGEAPYTFSVIAGTLPAGTTLNASTGTVSGLPTEAGTFSFTIKVVDAIGSDGSLPSQVIIAAAAPQPSSIHVQSTPSAVTVVGGVYTQQNAVDGGVAPYRFSVVAGALPLGTNLDPATGTVFGTLTGTGEFTYTIQVVDANGLTVTEVINGRIEETASNEVNETASEGAVGEPFVYKIEPHFGKKPYRFHLIDGKPPVGTTLDSDEGVVSGVPIFEGPYSFTVQVIDAAGITLATTVMGSIGTLRRVDPTQNAAVRGVLSAQALATERLTGIQIENIFSHLQKLRTFFETKKKSADMNLRISFLNPSHPYTRNADYFGSRNEGQSQLTLDPSLLAQLPVDLWVAGIVDTGSVDILTGDLSNTNQLSSSGLTVGLDVDVLSNLIIGGAFGVGQDTTHVDLFGSQNLVNSEFGTAYFTYQPLKKLYIDGLAGYSGFDNTSQRWSEDSNAIFNGGRTAYVTFGSLALSSQSMMQGIDFKPYVRADAMIATLGSYTESGGQHTLTYAKANLDTQLLSAGMQLFKVFNMNAKERLTPTARIQYMRAFGGGITQGLYYTDLALNSQYNYLLALGVVPTNTGSLGLSMNYENRSILVELGWQGTVGADSYMTNQVRASFTVRV